jgi:hypothetical protein
VSETIDDIVGSDTGEPEVEQGGSSAPTAPPSGRPLSCAEPGCDGIVPPGSHPARKYCDLHLRGQAGRAARARAGLGREKPPKLVVQVGKESAGKKDQRARDTAQGAAAFANVVATGLSMSGDQVCAAAVAGGSQAWGDAVGELSKYQPWLQQLFAPVGGDSQLGAWLGFLMATGAIALPVLAHHGMLPESVGARLGGVMVAADDAASQSSPAA